MIVTAAAVVSGVTYLFKVYGVSTRLRRMIARYKGRPNADDVRELEKFAALVNERRVFFVPYSIEVIECCVGSLEGVRDAAERIVTTVRNPGAKAVVGALLDDLRAFLDTWRGRHTPREGFGPERLPLSSRNDPVLAEFYRDLGALRERARVWMTALADIAPTGRAPNLSQPQDG